MKKWIISLFLFLPLALAAQGERGQVTNCAPFKDGRVCYTENVEVQGKSKAELFANINKWSQSTYGMDIFLSNVAANKKAGTLMISSKVELLLENKAKAIIKFRMNINCRENRYEIKVSNIRYQYDPDKNKTQMFPAEDILINNGKGNKVALVTEPELLCNATFFFVERLYGDVYDAALGK